MLIFFLVSTNFQKTYLPPSLNVVRHLQECQLYVKHLAQYPTPFCEKDEIDCFLIPYCGVFEFHGNVHRLAFLLEV